MEASLRKTLRIRLDALGIEPNHRLGQNFLVDETALERIVAAASIAPSDAILEIGAGPGQLTSRLAAQAGRVVAIEKDSRLLPLLEPLGAAYPSLTIVASDARQIDFATLFLLQETVKVVANLPYYLTSDFLQKCLLELPQAVNMLFLMQTEAAKRLVSEAGTKSYGPLAVLTHLYGQHTLALTVPPQAFMPAPTVSSTLLLLTRTEPAAPIPWKALHRFVVDLFSTRRKTILGSVKRLHPAKPVDDILKALGLPSSLRVEALTPPQFLTLFRALNAAV